MTKKKTARQMARAEKEKRFEKLCEIASNRGLECEEIEGIVHELFILIEKEAKFLKWQIFEDHAVTKKSKQGIQKISDIMKEVEFLIQDCESTAMSLRAARDRNGVWFRIPKGLCTC